MGIIASCFVILLALFLVGWLSRLGTDGLNDIGANVAASVGMLVVFAIIMGTVSAGNIIQGSEELSEDVLSRIRVPFASGIVNYGSMRELLSQNPLEAIVSFMDMVLLSTIIELITSILIPLNTGRAASSFMVRTFTALIAVIISMVIFNGVIRNSEAYRWIVGFIGTVITLLSTVSAPLAIIAYIRSNRGAVAIAAGTVFALSRTRIMGVFRSAFTKSLILLLAVLFMETRFGSISGGLSFMSSLVVMLMPVILTIIGISIMLKCLKW